MDNSILDVIVIGAGHAGLSISYKLKKNNINHLVFEKGEIGNSWRTQRWDTFKLNTPNKVNILPGVENVCPEPDEFCSAKDFVIFLSEYVKMYKLPVMEQYNVLAIEKTTDSKLFSISVSINGSIKQFLTKQVVVASGSQNKKNIPPFAKNISTDILQLHTCEYKNASRLPKGAVFVVGTAQSGAQVAEDLIAAGKKVFISTSQVGRIPRRYRGKDIEDWFIITGFYDINTEEIVEPQIFKLKQPLVSGVGVRGSTISLQSLAKKGAVILGKTDNAESDTIFLLPNAANHIKFGDDSSKEIKNMIDDYILKYQFVFPNPELDDADAPDNTAASASNITSLNLKDNNINSIIWATGFVSDFSYLKLPVFNENGKLKHQNGISEIEGLYFLGLPWLRKRKSGIIWGIKDDAEFITQKILEHC